MTTSTVLVVGLASFAVGATFAGHGVQKSSRIELVNKAGKTTMVLDGDSRSLSILDETGHSECVSLGPLAKSYALRMRTEESRRGGVTIVSGHSEAAVYLGTDGEDLVPVPGRKFPPDKVMPFWVLNSSADTGSLKLQFAEPKNLQLDLVQEYRPKKARK